MFNNLVLVDTVTIIIPKKCEPDFNLSKHCYVRARIHLKHHYLAINFLQIMQCSLKNVINNLISRQ